jgi:thymidylate synthase (FAD)
LINDEEFRDSGDLPYEPFSGKDPLLNEGFTGISREIARGVLPVNTYSVMSFSMNLHNLFHFLRLRLDSHSQQEIRDYANVIFNMIKETGKFDITIEAFEDYILNGKTLSSLEMKLTKFYMNFFFDKREDMIVHASELGMTKREITEYFAKFGI